MKKLFCIFILLSSIIVSICAESYPFEGITYVEILDHMHRFTKSTYEEHIYTDDDECVISSFPCEINKF